MKTDHRLIFAFLVILALTLAVYWPGLSGGYVFDDFSNLLDNPALAPTALHANLWHAVFSGQAGPFDRPLSMASFGAQMLFTGMNPWPLKFANVLLHLCNGWLVWLLTVRICNWLEDAQHLWVIPANILALLITAAWLLAPIQLTAVLYVIQREEALAATGVLLGLLAYWHGRMQLIEDRPFSMAWIWGSLSLGTLVATLAKETGVMLPVYAFVLEWIVLRGALAPACSSEVSIGRTLLIGEIMPGKVIKHPLFPVFATLLILPSAVGIAWVLPSILNGSSYSSRPFSMDQRLLTEGRVMVHYISWTIAPKPNTLSLYHDDFSLSKSWLSPWTTLASWALIAALLTSAVWLRRRLPLYALGVLWFFAGQSLVSTIIPLDLIYEHRNYLPDWGVFISFFGLLATWSPNNSDSRESLRRVAIAGLSALIVLQAFFTFLRAEIWGSEYRLAYFEATAHPKSARANFDLSQTLIRMSSGPGSNLFRLGMQQLEAVAKMKNSGITPWQSMIFWQTHEGKPIPEAWWKEFATRLANGKIDTSAQLAIANLVGCGVSGNCKYTPREIDVLVHTLQIGLQAHPDNTNLMAQLANAELNLKGDSRAAYALLLRSVAVSPSNVKYWLNLARFQTANGLLHEAQNSLARVKELEGLGADVIEVNRLAEQISSLTADRHTVSSPLRAP